MDNPDRIYNGTRAWAFTGLTCWFSRSFSLCFISANMKLRTKGMVKTLLLAVVTLYLMVFILIPGVPKVAGWFELFFVNTIGMPYNSGLLFFIIVLTAALVVGIRYSIKSGRVILNYAITAIAVIMIGYSSYAMIMIRSSARPPMNQNNPSDIFSLVVLHKYGAVRKLSENLRPLLQRSDRRREKRGCRI